jgi:hypothetical protein
MAMTLKASGLATDLTSCVAVDDDDTIKDFVGATISLDTDVAASVSTAATWAGVTRSPALARVLRALLPIRLRL